MDRGVYYDGGYSGWVQLESGDIYVVDYIIDETPLAHIPGYLVNRSDIFLFPEVALPTIAPVIVPSPSCGRPPIWPNAKTVACSGRTNDA